MLLTKDATGRAERLRALHRSLVDDVPRMREVQFRIGRTLLEICRLGEFTSLGTTTYPMYCEGAGLSPVEGRELLAMVQAAEVRPEVEAKVVEAKITPQKASLVNEVLKRPELQKPGEDLLALAEKKSAGDLLDEVKKRKEEARIGEPPVTRKMQTSPRGSDVFNRCGVLLGRRAGRLVSEGETLETISDYFLDREDPEREAERLKEKDEKAKAAFKERPLPTGALTVEDLERSRHIAAMTKRELIRVAGDRCWVHGCSNRIFLDRCHRRPYRANGSNRIWNLLYLCHDHHGGFDRGEWILKRRSDGVWLLIAKSGSPAGMLLDEVGRFLDAQGVRDGTRGRAPP